MHRQGGFTLVELMISVAIIAVLAAIAMPLYNNYITTSRQGALVESIATMEIFQEDFRMRTGAYLTTAANVAAITAAIDWTPQRNDGTTYSIAAGANGSYQVTARDASGVQVCRRLPDNVAC